VGRCEVLELVDEEVPVVGLHRATQLAISEQCFERAEHLLVEVDRPSLAQRLAVRLIGGREPGDVVEGVLHLLRIAQAEADECEAVEVGRDRVGVHAPLPARHELLHDRAHITLVEQLGPVAPRAAEDRVAPGVERVDARAQPG
jgi:hypothetical protein